MTTAVVIMTGNIQSSMEEMRAWLDSKRYQPSLFRYQARKTGKVAQVEFRVREEAEAFAAHFHGKLLVLNTA
jgi:hypothetical protein